MDGLVDLHTHSLPGVDDGSDCMEESIRMLTGLRDLGFSHVFTTPHHRLDSWRPISPEVVLSGVRSLGEALSGRGHEIRLYPGIEYDLDETLPERVSDRPGRGGYVLVDMGFWGVPGDIAGLLGRVRDLGVEVLLAHPERNGSFCRRPDLVRTLLDSGVLFTGNIGSIAGYYGKQIRKDCAAILKAGGYWAMASDLHSPEQLTWIGNGLEEIKKQSGRERFLELLHDHPIKVAESVLEGTH